MNTPSPAMVAFLTDLQAVLNKHRASIYCGHDFPEIRLDHIEELSRPECAVFSTLSFGEPYEMESAGSDWGP